MNNIAYSKKRDEHFNRGTVYQASSVYQGMIDVCVGKEMITVSMDDSDFIFIINPNRNIIDFMKENCVFYDYSDK